MAWTDPNLWLAVAYTAAFVILCFRHGQFNWLWGSVVLWVGFGLVSAQIMPGVLGITHLANLYPVYGYITLAALFPLAGGWTRDAGGRPVLGGMGTCLPLLAVSGAVLHLAFAVYLAATAYLYPPLLPESLLFYLLSPAYWIACQTLLMLLMWLHRRIGREPPAAFSLPQMQAVFLIALLMHGTVFIDANRLWRLLYWLLN